MSRRSRLASVIGCENIVWLTSDAGNDRSHTELAAMRGKIFEDYLTEVIRRLWRGEYW